MQGRRAVWRPAETSTEGHCGHRSRLVEHTSEVRHRVPSPRPPCILTHPLPPTHGLVWPSTGSATRWQAMVGTAQSGGHNRQVGLGRSLQGVGGFEVLCFFANPQARPIGSDWSVDVCCQARTRISFRPKRRTRAADLTDRIGPCGKSTDPGLGAVGLTRKNFVTRITALSAR